MLKKIIIFLIKMTSFQSLFSDGYILISKLDAIGDYILIRNFLVPFKRSSFVQGRKILFLANATWRPIYEEYDKEFADKIVWVNVERILKNRFYRFYILLILNRFKIHTVIQPTFSRDSIVDFLLLSLNSDRKIGRKGDDLNYSSELKILGDQKYDQLINEDSRIKFEFDRNKYFFSHFDSTLSSIQLNIPYKQLAIKKDYISFFVGANDEFRQLSIENLVFITRKILEFTNYEIFILGGKREKRKGEILSEISQRITSQCGRTTLVETIDLVGNSKAVLTMDSSGLHMAMACNVRKVFCFSNGNYIFRFTPYPENYERLKVFFPPLIQRNILTDKELLYQSFSRGSLIPINTIDFHFYIDELIKDIKEK
jgi:ADP-heptose:LPS heptosyltransferase